MLSVIALLALLLLAFVTATKSGRAGAFSGWLTDVAGAFGQVVTAPARWVHSVASGAEALLGGAKLNAKLRAENAALLQWRDQARALSERLQVYEKLHNIKSETLPLGLTGRMIGESATMLSQTGLVNLGAKDGVQVNWIVLNQTGLIGRVIAVGQNHARVILLSDGDSRVPVMGELTRTRALVSGDKTAAPRLAHLNTPPLMRDGERVVTSGDDGIFPRGLAVGQAGIGPDKLWRVRLASGVSAIDFVRLIPPNAFVAPIDPVTQPNLPPPPNGDLATQDAPPAGRLGGGEVLPLAAGATAVPVAATPEAIRAAQKELIRSHEREVQEARALTKKLEAERDEAREMARRLVRERAKAATPAKTTPPQTTRAPAPSGNEPPRATSPPASNTIVSPPVVKQPNANPPPLKEGAT